LAGLKAKERGRILEKKKESREWWTFGEMEPCGMMGKCLSVPTLDFLLIPISPCCNTLLGGMDFHEDD
jgi:hypothetical protein